MRARIAMAVFLVLMGYLSGSISFAYLLPRWARGIDLREVGSRKLSGSNVHNVMGVGGLVLTGILDVLKSMVPTWVALRLGQGLLVAACVGLAAMVGHNWSAFLQFKGGRGIGAALGALVLIFPWGVGWMLAWLAAGRLMPHAAAGPALVGFVGLPILAQRTAQPEAVVWACLAMLLVIVIKRLEANREPLPPGESVWRVLWRRLVLDRDIADFDAWNRRGAEEGAKAPAERLAPR